ncbi:AIPR family protein [Sorangium sp. So ce542]|uniref:AIPR family protein n=1 Tax=Sorangium sp. So ce542 TaxID=3133316 RepID=UPI003F60404A
MNRYSVLIRVLDQLRAEAPAQYKSYHPPDENPDALNAARAKAFIHLFLKVHFGILDFPAREAYITEGGGDGGIDAYYIDTDRRAIYFIQSKFRQSEKNFEAKAIEAEELLRMDVSRILQGEVASELGVPYNSKILAMVRKIRAIEDIARYQYRVIVIANAKGITKQKLFLLTGGLSTELFDYAACYTKLVFPLVSGSFFSADSLHISLNLSNKSAGAKISYTALTAHARCEITVVFVPTIEVAKAMYKYRNSILKHNPRSYLDHEGQSVNREIRSSIENIQTNEFALYNNGITVLSDETYINERIGQKDRAQLTLVNPQIINGGQTAYTLSQIYKNHIDSPESVFGEKEVLVKIITFDSSGNTSEADKLSLIESISRATNSQTAVTSADRKSNDLNLVRIQERAYELLGIFVERKRGEFVDGMREGYLTGAEVVDRATFLRAANVALGQLRIAGSRKIMLRSNYGELANVSDEQFRNYGISLIIWRWIVSLGARKKAHLPTKSLIMQVAVGLALADVRGITWDSERTAIESIADEVVSRWDEFYKFWQSRRQDLVQVKDSRGKITQILFYALRHFESRAMIIADVIEFFSGPPSQA